MPVCDTKFHGRVEFEPEQLLDVPNGLFGFPGERQLLLLEVPSVRPLVFIQSIRNPNLCFLALPAQVIDPAYKLQLAGEDIEALGYSAERPPLLGTDLLCLALLSKGPQQTTTANLQAPLIIDIARHRGRQVIVETEYSAQHPYLTPMAGQTC